MSTREIGEIGEQLGLSLLKNEGYKIIETNFRSHFGEIDIIAKDKGYMVFVEVKFRRSRKYGPPVEAVNRKKQDKIIKSALEYIKVNRMKEANIRFDVLSIGPGDNEIELIKNAFMSTNRYTY
jgi:putative endonuclease